MNKELIAKAKEAKSAEELIALAKENEIELTEERAKELFEQFHATGELSDEELDMVGGGCSTKVDGMEYTVVTSFTKCFNGQYEKGYEWDCTTHSPVVLREDNKSLRKTWLTFDTDIVTVFNSDYDARGCGNCLHLEFKAGTGYCGKSGK